MRIRLLLVPFVFLLSSCAYFQSNNPTNEVKAVEYIIFEECFEELSELPKPTYIEGVEFLSQNTNEVMIQYFYALPSTEEKANEAFHKYQQDIINENKLEYFNDERGIYLSKNGLLVALMTAGIDDDLGYFLTISFKK